MAGVFIPCALFAEAKLVVTLNLKVRCEDLNVKSIDLRHAALS